MSDNIKILKTEILSNNWYVLKKITYEYFKNDHWQKQTREAYDRGNGATILVPTAFSFRGEITTTLD